MVNLTLNLTQAMINLEADPCYYVKSFNEQLSVYFKLYLVGLFVLQIIKFVLIERFSKRYKNGTLKDTDSLYIAFTTIAIISYLQGVFFLFLIFAGFGLFV